MKIKKNIALSDSGFVFDPATGDSFTTNLIGMEIIKMLKDGKSHQEIKTAVLKKYLTDEATFEKDNYDFINMLTKHRLTDGDEKEKD